MVRLRLILIPDTGLRTYSETLTDVDVDSPDLGTDLVQAVIDLYRMNQEDKTK